MTRKTKAQRKAAIIVWTAKFYGKCPLCDGRIEAGRTLVCKKPDDKSVTIHYVCHPDWFSAPLKDGATHG